MEGQSQRGLGIERIPLGGKLRVLARQAVHLRKKLEKEFVERDGELP